MSKLGPPTCAQVKRALRALGFEQKPTNAGSHEKFEHKNFRGCRRVVTVDCPKAPFHPYLIKSMARQAGLNKREFHRLCVGDLAVSKIPGFSES